MSLTGEPLSFGFKRTCRTVDAVKRKDAVDEEREFISEFGQEPIEKDTQSWVIPKQANTFSPGAPNAFVPRFVPKGLTTKAQLASEERFEAAEVKAGTSAVQQYGLQPRNGSCTADTLATEFESDTEAAEKARLEAFRAEVEALPDEVDSHAYERMPVEVFGMAMLKSMDWKEGQVLGKNKDRAPVEAMEFLPRASRLGLGAAPSSLKTQKKRGPTMVLPVGADGKVRHVRTLDEKLVPYEEAGLKLGDRRQIVMGVHKGFPCTVVQPPTLPDDTVVVRLPNEEQVSVSLKELGPLAAPAEEAAPQRKKQRTETEPTTVRSSLPSCLLLNVRLQNGESEVQESWLMTGIRVRIVDKRLDKGQSYLKKGVLVDIVRPGVANVVLDHSQSLKEHIKEAALETVIPRNEGSSLLIVKGELRGSKATLIQRKSDKGRAAVQLASDLSVHQLSFDDIAEYVRP